MKGLHLLPPTTRAVSYAAEYAADRTPPVRVGGTLTWIIRGGAATERHYELRFRVPNGGRFVQAPFEPRDLHAFDAEGRASSPAFPTMQIHPQRPMGGEVDLFEGPDRILGYHLGPDAPSIGKGEYRRPFLYPVIGPDGIAILDHPDNPNHPTMFHCRNDGWACASFTGDAPYVLRPGQTLHLRYRVLLHRGSATDANVAQHFMDYAAPIAPTVTP